MHYQRSGNCGSNKILQNWPSNPPRTKKSKSLGARTTWDQIPALTLSMTLGKFHNLPKSVFSPVEWSPYLMEWESELNNPLQWKHLAESGCFRLLHPVCLSPSPPHPSLSVSPHLRPVAHTTPVYFFSHPIVFLPLTLRCYLNAAAQITENPFNLSITGTSAEIWIIDSKCKQWGSKSQGFEGGLSFFYHVTVTAIWNKARNIF